MAGILTFGGAKKIFVSSSADFKPTLQVSGIEQLTNGCALAALSDGDVYITALITKRASQTLSSEAAAEGSFVQLTSWELTTKQGHLLPIVTELTIMSHREGIIGSPIIYHHPAEGSTGSGQPQGVVHEQTSNPYQQMPNQQQPTPSAPSRPSAGRPLNPYEQLSEAPRELRGTPSESSIWSTGGAPRELQRRPSDTSIWSAGLATTTTAGQQQPPRELQRQLSTASNYSDYQNQLEPPREQFQVTHPHQTGYQHNQSASTYVNSSATGHTTAHTGHCSNTSQLQMSAPQPPQKTPTWQPLQLQNVTDATAVASPQRRVDVPSGQTATTSGPQDIDITIDQLTAYRAKWRIVARITKKTPVRNFKFRTKDGEGSMFSVDLVDSKGNETRAAFFGQAVSLYYEMLEERKTFSFSGGRVKAGDKRYSQFAQEITFDEHATILPIADDGGCPQVVYNFKSLATIEQTANGEVLDIAAVLVEVDPPSDIALKAGGTKTRQNVTLLDDSGVSCRLTLWGEFCSLLWQVGSVALFKSLRISDYGGKSLNSLANTLAESGSEAIASNKRAHKLQQWYQLQGNNALHDARQLSNSKGGVATATQTIAEMKADAMELEVAVSDGLNGQGGGAGQLQRYHTIEPATINFIQHDNKPFYMACPHQVPDEKNEGKTRSCNRKMDPLGGTWCCAADHQVEVPSARWIAQLSIVDHTGLQYVSSFDEVGIKVMGCEATIASELWDKKEQNALVSQEWEALFRKAQFKRFRLRLRSKKEVWNDEERLKFSIIDIAPVNVLKDAKTKLSEVKASLAD